MAKVEKKESPKEMPMATAMPKMKPRLSIDAEDLPEIKDWTINQEYELKVKLVMKSINAGDDMDIESSEKGRPMEARFEVISAEPLEGRKAEVQEPVKKKMDMIKEKAKQY